MPNSLFISYSRQQSPFVDLFLETLENNGHPAWVDYKNLTPGKPWLEQILAGIKAADIMLLVVSKASMLSDNVALEYQHALKHKKRIILIIFQAVPLPIELQSCEWVDFRGSLNANYAELIMQIENPAKKQKAPQKGFKASAVVWVSFFISLIMILVSIPGWWTLYLPMLILPFPAQIMMRNINYYRARFAIITMPLALFLSWAFFLSYPFTNRPFMVCFLISFLTTPISLFLLSSRGMRLWGKPSASAPRSIRANHAEIKTPDPVSFFIEHAPQDKKYAEAITRWLKKYGHPEVTDAAQAKVNFAVISSYKNTTDVDPQKRVVFPVLIQDAVIEDKNIQRIQWIDFRRGLRNLDNLARLLPQPAKLMKALGAAPNSGQGVYPRIIQMLDYFLTLLAFFSIGIWIPLSLEFGQQFLQYNRAVSMDIVRFIFINIILCAATLNTIFTARRALISRQGENASLLRLIGSLMWVGFVGFTQTLYIVNVMITITSATTTMLLTDPRGTVALFLPLSFILGMTLISLFAIWNWRDLVRWFPQK